MIIFCVDASYNGSSGSHNMTPSSQTNVYNRTDGNNGANVIGNEENAYASANNSANNTNFYYKNYDSSNNLNGNKTTSDQYENNLETASNYSNSNNFNI
jgi:hypothetical protein